jgi:hypothetical protein
MVQILGRIEAIEIAEPQADGSPTATDATVVIRVEEPYGDGDLVVKLYPAATGGLAVGPCRIQVDQA